MADQERQLKLTIELDDQASPGLAALRKSLTDIAPAVQQSSRRAQQGVDEVSRALGNLAREYLGVTRTLQEVAKVSLAGATAGLAIVQMKRASDAMRDWARQGVEMGNAARQMGLSAGQFKDISNQLRVAGLNAQQATTLVQNFNKAYAELLLTASKRQQLFAMAGPNGQAMADSIKQLGALTNTVDRLNFIRAQGENVYRNEMMRTHDTVLAAYKQQEYLQVFGATQLMNVHHNLTQAEAKRLGLTNELTDKQRDLIAAMEKERATREEIKDIINDMLSGPEKAMVDNVVAFEEQILSRLEKITNFGFNKGLFGLPTPEEGLRQLQQHQQDQKPGGGWIPDFWNSLRNMQLPSFPENKSEFPDPLGDALRNAFRRRTSAGGAARFYGFTDTGSQNVVDDNTDEVHRLNLNMDRLLDQLEGKGGGGLGGGAGGGGGGGGGYTPGTGPGTGPTGPDSLASSTGPGGGLELAPGGGVTGAPLAAVMGNQPFGINVSDQKFTEITGLPAAFKNVTPGQRAFAAQISTGMGPGGRAGLGGQFLGQKPAADWPQVGSPGGIGGAKGGGPVSAGPGGKVDETALFQSYVTKFKGSNLDGFVPKDGAEFGITKGTPEEWARLALATSRQESGLNANARGGGLNQFEAGDLRNYGLGGRSVNDPDAQAQALVNSFTKYIPQDGVITNPQGGHRVPGMGAGRYFGSLRRDFNGPGIDVIRQGHLVAAGKVAAANTQPTQSIAPTGRSGVTVSPLTAGSGYNPLMAGVSPNGSKIDIGILQNAAALVQVGNTKGENTEAVRKYITSQGLTYTSGENCAEFVTAVLSRSQHLPPGTLPYGVKTDYPAAASYLHYGTAVDAAHAQPGDVLAIQHHAMIVGPNGYDPVNHTLDILSANMDRRVTVNVDPRTGKITNSYYNQFRIGHLENPNAKATADATASAAAPLPPGVTAMPEGVKIESNAETFRRIQAMAQGLPEAGPTQANIDAWKASKATLDSDDILKGSRYDTGDSAADRAALDKQQLAKATTSSIKLKVRHHNAPPDVKVSASGDAFKGGSTERSNAAPAPAKPAAAPTKFKAGELEFG